MYKILLYHNRKGESPIEEYLKKLSKSKTKSDRIKLSKIQDYIKVLKRYGISVGMPYIKHIDGDIWELRPAKDRIFFVAYVDRQYVLLHSFTKKTKKTPPREIEKAKREWEEFKERSGAK